MTKFSSRVLTSRFVSAAFFVLLSCTSLSFAAPVGKAPSSAKSNKIAAAKSPAKPILFEIAVPKDIDQQGASKAYLYASIHVAKADFYPLPASVMRAYKASKTLVVEADVTNQEANSEISEKLSYKAPDKLESHLRSSTWDMLTQMTGSASSQFQRYAPVMVAMGLTISVAQQLGYEPNYGLDLYFINQARKDKKEIVELEGVAFQSDVLAGLSDAEGDAMLASTLETFRKGEVKTELNRIVEAWKNGDLETLTTVMREAGMRDLGSQKLMKALMDDRNPLMLEKISKLMREGKKPFVVLGAGHFAGGDSSILELFRQRGFAIKAIKK